MHAPGGAKIHMDGLQLVRTGGGDQHLHGHEATLAAVPHDQGVFVKIGHMPAHDLDDQRGEAFADLPHQRAGGA